MGRGIHVEILSLGLLSMDGEWQRVERNAEGTVLALMREVFYGLKMWFHLARWDAASIGPGSFQRFVSITLDPRTGSFCADVMPLAGYKKLALFDEFVEAWAKSSTGSALLEVTDAFAAGVGQWLKVAGGCKAAVLQGARTHASAQGRVSVELGAFIGYTSARLARPSSGTRGPGGISVEIDPVHKYFARHFIDLARLSSTAEVWCGQAKDCIPRLAEEVGSRAAALAFVDHSGARFREDLVRLAAVRVRLADAQAVADNVLKPGVPLLVWHSASAALSPAADESCNRRGCMWSLREFMHDNLEDWMLVGP